MTIDWDDVRVFLTAVRAGDYSNAARKLGMDRTTVGRRFARLERAAGRSLWEQAVGGYRPTVAGRAALRAATAMERAMTRLAAELDAPAGGISGPVRIAGTAGLATMLLPAFAEVLARHDGISIEIVGARDAIAAVQQRHADLGFAIARSKPRDLHGEAIGSFALARYVRRDRDVPDRAIAWGHAMMLANPQPWARLNGPEAGDTALEVDALATMHEAVRAGLGSAWLWRVPADRDPDLRRFDDAAPAATAASIWVVHRRDLAAEPAVAMLRDAAAGIVRRYADGTDRVI